MARPIGFIGNPVDVASSESKSVSMLATDKHLFCVYSFDQPTPRFIKAVSKEQIYYKLWKQNKDSGNMIPFRQMPSAYNVVPVSMIEEWDEK